MDATLGLSHFIAQADGLAKFILAMMLVASIASWYLIASKALSGWLT